jgi:hypothetical protein
MKQQPLSDIRTSYKARMDKLGSLLIETGYQLKAGQKNLS